MSNALLSEEEIEVLLEEAEGIRKEEKLIKMLISETLIAKIMFFRKSQRLVSLSDMTSKEWNEHYEEETRTLRVLLDTKIEDNKNITQNIKNSAERLRVFGIHTFKDLCLSSEDTLRSAGFSSIEIKKIINIFLSLRLRFVG